MHPLRPQRVTDQLAWKIDFNILFYWLSQEGEKSLSVTKTIVTQNTLNLVTWSRGFDVLYGYISFRISSGPKQGLSSFQMSMCTGRFFNRKLTAWSNNYSSTYFWLFTFFGFRPGFKFNLNVHVDVISITNKRCDAAITNRFPNGF